MTGSSSINGRRVLLNGAVFSGHGTRRSSSFAREILASLRDQGAFVAVLLFDGCGLGGDDDIIRDFALRYAPFDPEATGQPERYHGFTHFLTRMLEVGSFDYYIDSDPFCGPLRLETPGAPTIVALCDDAVLRSPASRDAAGLERRYNGLMRLDRADAIVCSGEDVKLAVCRYLGKAPAEVFILGAPSAAGAPEQVDAPAGVSAAANHAEQRWQDWRRSIRFQTFSSLPGEGCGVADFTVAYVRSAPAQAALHFSSGDPAQVAALECKLFSHLDFEAAGDLLRVPRLFNFAVSPALIPGLDLLRTTARAGDILVVHERWYSDGFMGLLRFAGKSADVGIGYFRSDEEATEFTQRSLSLSPANAPYPPMVGWLSRLPVTIVSPLSPNILEQVSAYRGPGGEPARNEFSSIEDRIAFVPMGIDDRADPATLRAARRHRAERGIAGHALLIGHFGLVLDHPKMLRRILAGFVDAASAFGWSIEGRPIHFKLCGKIVEPDLVDHASALFDRHGRADRLHLSNPAVDREFDAEMTACDAMICCRVQSRGQQSHAMVRALSLGLPVIVNRASGWVYDPATTIEDDDIEGGLRRVLSDLASGRSSRLRETARAEFERAHRVDSLLSMFTDGGGHAGAV
ncbi:MAG: hypothetical protein P4M07_14630 [Xanthobacteraceae bacterium]|nr:hypothetical protein [Xanthobacteraceae bacterium]